MTQMLPIPSRPGYFATESGNIYNERTHRTLKGSLRPEGYVQISFFDNGRRTSAYRHKLVWEAYHGVPPKGHIISHANGIRSDDRPENLILTTKSEVSATYKEREWARIQAELRGEGFNV